MQLCGDIAKWEEVDGGLIIEGIASTEDVDHAGEVVEADAMRKALPEYLRSGSIREMHTLAAGKPLAAFVDDEGKTHLRAKIVDPNTILKIKEGILKMFSIGGKSLRKEAGRVKELLLKEISVVDHGCNGKASFSICKMDSIEHKPKSNMKEDLLKLLADPDVVAAIKGVSPEAKAPSAEDLKKSLGLDVLETQLIDIKKRAEEATVAAQKAERDALVAEASKAGKVIPLDNDDIAKTDVSILRKMIEKLPAGVVSTGRKTTLSVPEKKEDLQKFLETKRLEGAAAIGALINAGRGASVN